MVSVVKSRVSSHHPVIETVATEKEARRVLEWQHEVARSVTEQESDAGSEYTATTHRPETRRYESYPQQSERPPMRLVRRVTETTETYPAAPAGSTGMSGKAILGTLLGAAAGAAVAYAMVCSEDPEYIPAPVQRRASVAGSKPAYSTYGVNSPGVRIVERIEMEPARTYVSARDNRSVTPRYVPGYSVAPSMPPMSGRSDMHRIEDRSRDDGRYLNNDASVVSRSRRYSDAGSAIHRPLTILPAPPKSQVSHTSSEGKEKSEAGRSTHTKVAPSVHSKVAPSVHSKAPSMHSKAMSVHSKAPTVHSKAPSVHSKAPSVHSKAPSAHPKSVVDAPAPARSHVSSASTIKASSPPAPTAKSKVSATTIVFRPRESSGESKVSARHVALPKSVVSGVGYERSIAPSDSVSNAGSRRSRR
ncbi:hypothetical protein PVAG01_08175 [Phlyctema vagabunda]|uniref:Uncharacterized protein n=1 Tax=Phlyctema vagabunda TaxID=108571 RepID=A0ABR4P928_9HELO